MPASKWAVGSPSVIMMICLVPVWRASIWRLSRNVCCMFVPYTKSHETSGSCSGVMTRATSLNPTMPRKSRGNCIEISECRAMATFLAARKLSRIGIDSERSSISTVELRTTCSVCSISKSSGVSRTGVPPPVRRTALRTVRSMWRLNGSPNS